MQLRALSLIIAFAAAAMVPASGAQEEAPPADEEPTPREELHFDLDKFETTGEERQCLRRNEIEGFLVLEEDAFIFLTGEALYLNRSRSPCYGATKPNLRFQFAGSAPSMICRNDSVYVSPKTSAVNEGPSSVCVLRNFERLRPKTSAP